jgi:hypothetical protein
MTTRKHHLLIAIGLLALFLLYRLTAPPGLTWQHGGVDGGELALASWYPGPAHPPGYALYVLLGWLFMKLPLAAPIVRLQMMSHVLACLTVLLTGYAAWLIASRQDLPRPRLTGWVAALTLALSRLFWTQAIIVEVYALLFLFFALTLVCALCLREHPDNNRMALLCGFVQGMAMTHHLSAVLWLPGLLVLWNWRQWRGLLIGLALGLWPILLLVLLGGHHPAANWGGVNASPQALLNHITAAQYHLYVAGVDAAAIWQRVRDWFVMLVADFALVGIIPLLVGMARLGGRLRVLLSSSLLWWIPLMLFTTLYMAQDTAAVYSGPLHIIAAIWLALGLAQITARMPGVVPIILAVAYTVLLFTIHLPVVNLAQDTQPQQFVQDALVSVPPRSVVITNNDQETFTLWYAHFVEGCCGEWAIVDRRLLRHEWYRNNLSQLYPFLPLDVASIDLWLSDSRLADYAIASSTFLLPAGGRQVQRAGAWYISPTVQTE